MAWPDSIFCKNKIIEKIEDAIDRIKTAITNSETNIKTNSNNNKNTIVGKTDAIKTVVDNTKTNTDTLKTNISNLSTSLTNLTNTINTINTNLNTVKNTTTEINNNVGNGTVEFPPPTVGSAFTVEYKDRENSIIKVKTPGDFEISGTILAETEGVDIVGKVGEYPKNPKDGEKVLSIEGTFNTEYWSGNGYAHKHQNEYGMCYKAFTRSTTGGYSVGGSPKISTPSNGIPFFSSSVPVKALKIVDYSNSDLVLAGLPTVNNAAHRSEITLGNVSYDLCQVKGSQIANKADSSHDNDTFYFSKNLLVVPTVQFDVTRIKRFKCTTVSSGGSQNYIDFPGSVFLISSLPSGYSIKSLLSSGIAVVNGYSAINGVNPSRYADLADVSGKYYIAFTVSGLSSGTYISDGTVYVELLD